MLSVINSCSVEVKWFKYIKYSLTSSTLREYVEKLELLNSPEERKRRLEEVPIVHADPNMDPSYDFDHSTGELDQKKQGF